MTQEEIDLVKDKADIVQIIGEYVPLKKKGINFIGKCPFHNEKTGSFTVNKQMNIYKCFGCGKSGDVYAFIMDHDKKTFGEAVIILAAKVGVDIEAGQKKDFVKPPPRLTKLTPEQLDHFENGRKIPNNVLLRMNVTSSVEWMPQFEDKPDGVPVVCFNYMENGEVTNIKFRGPKKSFKMAKDARLIFYNVDALTEFDEIHIVEGEIDLLSAFVAKTFNVVSVPNGASLKGTVQLEYLNYSWEKFGKMKKVVLAMDNDPAGRRLREELARRIGKEKCWTVEYPEDCKDSNEVLIKHGAEVLEAVYKNAKQWPLEGLYNMDKIFPTVHDWYHNGYPEGTKAGIVGFDHLLTFGEGYITTTTGIPSHGKDEFLNLIKAGFLNQGIHVADCGFEESPEETTTKIAEKLTNKAFEFRKNPAYRMTEKEFEKAISDIDQYVHFFSPDEIGFDIDSLIKLYEQMVLRFGCSKWFINPWNWIEQRRNGMTETEFVSHVYTKLIVCARKTGSHIFMVAHTTKMKKSMVPNPLTGKTDIKYDVPDLYDISGGANFYNKTSNGITVFREGFNTYIYVTKVKQSWLGQKGHSKFLFDTLTREYIFKESSVEMPGYIPKDQSATQADIFGADGPPAGSSWKQIELDEGPLTKEVRERIEPLDYDDLDGTEQDDSDSPPF